MSRAGGDPRSTRTVKREDIPGLIADTRKRADDRAARDRKARKRAKLARRANR